MPSGRLLFTRAFLNLLSKFYCAVAVGSVGARHAVPGLTLTWGRHESLTLAEKSQNHRGRSPATFPTDALLIAVQFAAGATCAAAAGDEHICVLLTERITTAATATPTAAPTPTAAVPAAPSPPTPAPAPPPTLVVLLISVTVTGVAGTGGVGAALNCTLDVSPAPTITHGPSIR